LETPAFVLPEQVIEDPGPDSFSPSSGMLFEDTHKPPPHIGLPPRAPRSRRISDAAHRSPSVDQSTLERILDRQQQQFAEQQRAMMASFQGMFSTILTSQAS
jgi:hypothetical protein